MTEISVDREAQPVHIIIADDHVLVRAGLRRLLDSEEDLVVVGEAANGREAVELARRLRPDLVLLDMQMPEMDGLTAMRIIKQELPETSVIIITMHEDSESLFQAFKAGAAGFLHKDTSHEELCSAIRTVLRGESFLNGSLAIRVLQRMAAEPERRAAVPPSALTPREREVLQLLAQGHTNREIAAALSISAGTAKVHVERIIGKLGVSDRTQAAVRAVELGLVDPS